MIQHRLLFGILMSASFLAVMFLDAWLDGSIGSQFANQPIKAPLLTLLAAGLMVPAHSELRRMMEQTGKKVFSWITLPASIATASGFFWHQFHFDFPAALAVFVSFLLVMFWLQARNFGTAGAIGNISGSLFVIVYLGVFCSFLIAIRIEFGLLMFLLFIFTIKSSDIGAYVIGSRFGKHKLCPSVSAGKTWEGLAGAVAAAAMFSVLLSMVFGIMSFWAAILFGAAFGLLGQLGDLVESMLKRDAAVKDASSSIPGFGGLLDVMDSPLATAPAAYAVFAAFF